MKILSKHHDYYDGVAAHGIDELNVYSRLVKKVPKSEIPKEWFDKFFEIHVPRINPFPLGSFDYRRIGFCGQIYTGWKVFGTWCYTVDQIRESILDLSSWKKGRHRPSKKNISAEKKVRQKYLKDFNEGAQASLRGKSWQIPVFNKVNVARYLEVSQERSFVDLFILLDAPIFIMNREYIEDERKYKGKYRYSWVTNINLLEYGFQRFKAPYEAHQKIAQFISNVLLSTGNEMVEISDVAMRDKKGFDDMSFKNDAPGARKLRRKKNRARKKKKSATEVA